MRLSLRLCFLFLSAVLLISFVSADYSSFVIIRETNSSQAIIYYQHFTEAGDNVSTIIQLTNPEEFSDLCEYLKNSQIEIVVLDAIGDDILIGLGTQLRQCSGVNVMVKFGESARIESEKTEPITEEENTTKTTDNLTEELNQTTETQKIQIPPGNNQIIPEEAISENESNYNNTLLAGLIIGISIIIGFVILAFVLKKK